MWIQLFFLVVLLTTNISDDDRLRDTIIRELRESPVIDASPIEVDVNNGIVTLSGEVINLVTRERAVEMALQIKGVRSVIDLLDVPVVPRTNEQLQTLVQKRLSQNPATADEALTVRARGGQVIVEGDVDSRVEAELVDRLVKSVAGVQVLDNRVRSRWVQQRSDDDIQRDIEQRIRWDARLDNDKIKVSVEEGIVRLSGRVGSNDERMHARIASHVECARNVDDELHVDPMLADDQHRDPRFVQIAAAEIETAIRDAWNFDPRVTKIDADISISVGSVTLRGSVTDLKTKQAAEQTAANTIGVLSVHNYLRVNLEEIREDVEIRHHIEEAFAHDPIVDRFEIHVSVDEGKVTLRGKIESYYEKARAEKVALHVPGIVDLLNQLEVSYDAPEFDPEFYAYAPFTSIDTTRLGTVHIKPDLEIKRAIESELWWSPMVDSDQVKVKVEAGVATLKGTVNSTAQAVAAIKNAMQGGAVIVKNRLRVKQN
jgi:osmotically-inducible protein OsmY